MIKFTVIPMIVALGVVGSAQAQDQNEVSLSKRALIEIIKDGSEVSAALNDLFDEAVFRQELSEMEGALSEAAAAVLSHHLIHQRSSSDQKASVDTHLHYVAQFEETGAQSSSRWPDDVLDMYVEVIEDDWRSFKKRSLVLLETESRSNRLTVQQERRLRELKEIVKELKSHLDGVRSELIS